MPLIDVLSEKNSETTQSNVFQVLQKCSQSTVALNDKTRLVHFMQEIYRGVLAPPQCKSIEKQIKIYSSLAIQNIHGRVLFWLCIGSARINMYRNTSVHEFRTCYQSGWTNKYQFCGFYKRRLFFLLISSSSGHPRN